MTKVCEWRAGGERTFHGHRKNFSFIYASDLHVCAVAFAIINSSSVSPQFDWLKSKLKTIYLRTLFIDAYLD